MSLINLVKIGFTLTAGAYAYKRRDDIKKAGKQLVEKIQKLSNRAEKFVKELEKAFEDLENEQDRKKEKVKTEVKQDTAPDTV